MIGTVPAYVTRPQVAETEGTQAAAVVLFGLQRLDVYQTKGICRPRSLGFSGLGVLSLVSGFGGRGLRRSVDGEALLSRR
jgi:hypothetical protein